MKNFLYSNLKTDSVKTGIKQLSKMNLAGLIVDFDYDETLCSILKINGIEQNFYRIKMYEYDIENPDHQQIENEIKKARDAGFYGFALDGEAYSNSNIWQKDQTKTFEFGEWLGKTINKYFDCVVIYPENLGGDKYFNYDAWLMGIINSGLYVKILTERTYEVWKPWEFFSIYNRIKKDFKDKENVEIVPGIWYESMSDFKFLPPDTIPLWIRKILCIPCQFIQFLNTFFIKNRFYYSETTDFLNSFWLRFLSN